MVNGWIAPALAVFVVLSPLAIAQEVGSNAYIDMYFGDWHASAPHATLGSLQERDILTRGDGMKPTKKGAVLRHIDSFSYGSLAPHASTASTRLDGKQEIFYFLSGHGNAVGGGDTVELYTNVAILMPSNLEFTINNTGDEPLTMYLTIEPTPAGFRPNAKMLVRDENTIPISSTDGHWDHIVKPLFNTADGLATLQSVVTVIMDPLTVGQPHKVDHDIEEIWASIDGTTLALVGPFLRLQTPGVAYLHPPDNLAPHTNINFSEENQAKFLYIARYQGVAPRK